MDLSKRIKELVGRDVEFIKSPMNGEELFVPVYINFNLKTRISEIASPTLEEAQNKFIKFLEGDSHEDTHAEPTGDREDT